MVIGISDALLERSQSKCELCQSKNKLAIFSVPPESLVVCDLCFSLMDNPSKDSNHWRCLAESMWSEFPVVQVTAYRLLKKLKNDDWARNLFDQIYLDDEIKKWADSNELKLKDKSDDIPPTKDSNGTILADGDAVTLIKDLEVKGANFTAKRGTLVKNISLTANPEQIEGRVNGTQIVLLTCFLKKSN